VGAGAEGLGECPLRKCCVERGVELCFECGEYPCSVLERFEGAAERLNRIRDLGFKRGIKE